MSRSRKRLLILSVIVMTALCGWAARYYIVTRFTRLTPLMAAAQAGDTGTVERELREGADPNRVWNEAGIRVHGSARKNVTPLLFALESAGPGPASRGSVVTLLMNAGADPCLGDGSNESPLLIAVQKHDVDTARALWQGDRAGCLKAHSAAAMSAGYTELGYAPDDAAASAMVEFLIDHVAQPGEADHPGALVASPNPAALVQLERLAARGVKADGESLVLASVYNKPGLIPWLVAHGADVNAPVSGFLREDSGPPLVRAAVNPNVEGLRALIDAGADVNAADTIGRTAVSTLVCESSCTTRPNPLCEAQVATLKLLLARGARRAGVSRLGRNIDSCLHDRPTDPYLGELEALLANGSAPR